MRIGVDLIKSDLIGVYPSIQFANLDTLATPQLLIPKLMPMGLSLRQVEKAAFSRAF